MIKELLTSTKARMKRLQDRLYAAILDYVVSTITTKDDLITFSNSNIDAINKIDKILNKRLEKELTGYKRYLLKGIKTILSNVYTEYSAIDIRAIEIGNDVNDRILKHAAKNVTQLTNITPIYDDIKKQAISLMSKYEGISLRELREAIKVKVEDKNIIQQYWSRFTYDIYSQYERIGANEIRKGLGLVFAVYEGGEIETTREFCEERSFNVYHISEIEGWVNLEWEGKPETGYNPIIDLGGYNCRHRLRWVSKEFAAAKRPEVRTLFAFEFNKAA